MAVYLSELIDEMRDLLAEDTDDQAISFRSKVRYLNGGLSAMFPRVYLLVRDVTVVIDTTPEPVYEYAVPAAITAGRLITVELEDDVGLGTYQRVLNYNITSGPTTDLMQIHEVLDFREGAKVRLTAAVPVTKFVAVNYAAAQTVTFDGPAYAWQLPVLFAMSMSMTRILHARMDYGKLSIQQQNTNITPNDIMTGAQYWMDRFHQQMSDIELPLPVVAN